MCTAVYCVYCILNCVVCIVYSRLTLTQDDIVCMARTPEGLHTLMWIVSSHCSAMKMNVSVSKSKVMTGSQDAWEVFSGEEVTGVLDRVIHFKYLGVESMLSPARAADMMKKRALSLARRYKAACMHVGRSGPDTVEVALMTWRCIAIPSITFGCEYVPFSDTAIDDIDRMQSAVAKDMLGLPVSAPNVTAQVILGLKTFRHKLYQIQLKYFLRVNNMEKGRWCKDAMDLHILGKWVSPYMMNMTKIMMEVGMGGRTVSNKYIDIVLDHHFLTQTNRKVEKLNLPALHAIDKLELRDYVQEGIESQVRLETIF